ncbi:helix-turn-helix domain-containing protein [Demequina gelatinilytica]|uniref:helix-turn-helix domain-containing protein n=1 Tax=Demequina gelatinilytica TaxID=1638980 RepID=UPI000A8B90DB|nr:helix-turn-helix transcriptional regulator [Demequina gelatinilytica]
MGKKFSEIAGAARATWSPDAVAVNTAAAQVFEAEMDLAVAIGMEIYNRRKALHLTQPELQRLSGVQQAEISRIESGVGNPTLSTLQRLTGALGTTLAVHEVSPVA